MKRRKTFIVRFSKFVSIKMKEALQDYICKLCNKETHDKKKYLHGHCAKCKLLRLKMTYTASKIEDINKFECHQQIKALKRKERVDTDEDDFSDNISENDDNKDLDFVTSSVSPKRPIVFIKHTKDKIFVETSCSISK